MPVEMIFASVSGPSPRLAEDVLPGQRARQAKAVRSVPLPSR